MTELHIVGPPSEDSVYHGVFPANLQDTGEDVTRESLSSYEEKAGKRAAWVCFSNEWSIDKRFPKETAQWISDSRRIPYIRLMLRSHTEQFRCDPDFTLDKVVNRCFDQDLESWFLGAASLGAPLIVEYGTEVNGWWFPWNAYWNGNGVTKGGANTSDPDGPAKFRTAYQHIIQMSRGVGAGNIVWVFHVNYNDNPAEDWNKLELYYPGSEYIHWIGVSVYGGQKPKETDWPQFCQLMADIYPRLGALSQSKSDAQGGPDKPIVIAEFGVSAPETDPDPASYQANWAAAALSALTCHVWPRIIGFSWWNERWPNGEGEPDTNMRLEDNEKLADVFKRLVAGNEKVLGKAVCTTRNLP